MNTKIDTCRNCAHFDALHKLCPMFTIRYPVGKVYLKRFPDSPVCNTEYLSLHEVVENTRPSNVEIT